MAIGRISLAALGSAAMIVAGFAVPAAAAEPATAPARATLSATMTAPERAVPVTAVTSDVVTRMIFVPLAAPKPPKPGKCNKYHEIRLSGARAMVRECRPNKKKIFVQAKVTDTKLNGRCAQVYAIYNKYPGTDYTKKVCVIKRERVFRLPTRKGTNAFIYLREVKR